MAYLFPCALIGDFTLERLSSVTNTEQANRWSSDHSTLALSFDYTYIKNNRRSLKLYYDTSTRRYATKGIDGTLVTNMFWNNPYGSTVADGSWATNIGMWLYSDTHYPSDGSNSTMLNYGYTNVANNSPSFANWNTSIQGADKWYWTDDEVDMQYTDIDRFRIGVSNDAGGNVYVNGMVLFKRSTSNLSCPDDSIGSSTNASTADYTWKNGIAFALTGNSVGALSYNVGGLVYTEDYEQTIHQLHSMETIDLIKHDPIKVPYSKFSNVRDYGKLKTYLFMDSYWDPYQGINVIRYAEPVIISNLRIDENKGQPHIVTFSCTLYKFSGV